MAYQVKGYSLLYQNSCPAGMRKKSLNTPSSTLLQSRNSHWQRQLHQLPKISASDFPALIAGPSGTGKELIARFLHKHSSRRNYPLVSINCSTLSDTLIESELFGHTKGSFTGAYHDRLGAFRAAKHGTLFLDEIGDLPLPLQPKLLRALENKEVRPVGSDKVYKTDIRIIAATHKNLKVKVYQGQFRSDLFYRLNVLSIHVPPLSNRMEDFENLIYQMAREYQVRFSHEAINLLKEHSWPGNIRELRNSVARAKALYGDNLIRGKEAQKLFDNLAWGGVPPHLKEIEKSIIYERLVQNKGNRMKTARDLGIPNSTLHDRIRSYNIDIKNFYRQIGYLKNLNMKTRDNKIGTVFA